MENHYEVIIIGGSAAGLAATLAIARTMKTVLCIDSGQQVFRSYAQFYRSRRGLAG